MRVRPRRSGSFVAAVAGRSRGSSASDVRCSLSVQTSRIVKPAFSSRKRSTGAGSGKMCLCWGGAFRRFGE